MTFGVEGAYHWTIPHRIASLTSQQKIIMKGNAIAVEMESLCIWELPRLYFLADTVLIGKFDIWTESLQLQSVIEDPCIRHLHISQVL